MSTSNPFDDLIQATAGDEKTIQFRYHEHRTNRNAQQKARMLSDDFKSFSIDDVLAKLADKDSFPDYQDTRHCLVFWARPTRGVKQLALAVQDRLREAFPNIWLMPEACMHMTTLEVTHSRTDAEIQDIISKGQSAFQGIADYTYDHRARLVKPLLGFDSTAIALSYLPAAQEPRSAADVGQDDSYTYHHLRRDMFSKCSDARIDVKSRYVALSAHLTMARIVTQKDFVKDGAEDELDPAKVRRFISTIEEINDWLCSKYWSSDEDEDQSKAGGEWLVGQERGITVREGQLWYGGGRTLREGQGF